MLASQLRHHPAWTPAGLAADLAAARDRLALMRAENLSVAAAFDLSYQDLTEEQQRLFRRLGLHPGPDFDAYAAAALDGTSLVRLAAAWMSLYDQHLLTEPAPGRYRLHDLLREHARALAATDDPAESDAATGRLLDYYLHTALAAGQHSRLGHRRTAVRRPATRQSKPPTCPLLGGRAPGWMPSGRNLHAATDYAAATGQPRHAIAIPAAMSGFLSAHGYWDQSAALYRTALAAARQADDRLGEADTLVALGVLQAETGDHPAAAATLAQAVALYGDVGDLPGQAHALNQLGYLQVLTGDYPAAAASTQRSLVLARSAGDRSWRPTPSSTWAGTAADRGLPGRGRQPAAGPGTRPRTRRPRKARPGPSTAWAWCRKRPGTTRPPPPATSKPWHCSVSSATCMARPMR